MVYIWKKYLKKIFKDGFNFPFDQKNQSNTVGDPFKLMNDIMKNFPKR